MKTLRILRYVAGELLWFGAGFALLAIPAVAISGHPITVIVFGLLGGLCMLWPFRWRRWR